ncbi:beta-galactosidase [Microbacterium sp. STN6]|uniref:glycoside hydrolase family 35 protein n=1 Tax=Microbacterium sp. STN6 TaxID=2995588 RepID=UPI002260AF2E|nr:glycoside hydrolase family 35 protein [Microbacterium sp. STN6]MCX7522252.1 beta-galactosidase [Microbacterium sp. STN6]
MTTFSIAGDDFVLDGRPHRILSGALHYFRVHPGLWADRIHKARLMGLNTIETYVPWNLHEPRVGEWVSDGPLDLGAFLDAVAAEGMHAIVRPGPYICAEWSNGGLPAWLFADAGVGLRRNEPQYMAAVERYLTHVLEIVAPRQVGAGGPVLLVQIENEYGAFGDDAEYLRELVRITRACGITVPLTTVDQPRASMLENGSLPELLKTASFGSRATSRLATLRAHQPKGPLMCSEFWDGWFDSWGEHHHTADVAESAAELRAVLGAGASVNIYMFHGGTNFGFTNGANDKGVYKPIVTSYDYDAPLDEAGNPTAKYWAFREVIAEFAPVPAEVPRAAADAPRPSSRLDVTVPLADVQERLGEWSEHVDPATFDELGHDGPFAVYATTIDTAVDAVLEFGEVRDRAQVFRDGCRVAALARDHHERAVTVPAGSASISVLVEDLGRVDYGPRLGEAKGLIGPALLDGEPLRRWRVLPLDLTRLDVIDAALDAGAPATATLVGPSFARGQFVLEEPADLFLDTGAWGKGAVWVNGFALGRYWSRGPQRTLYVPAPVLREGANTVLVLELEAARSTAITFAASADLGHLES